MDDGGRLDYNKNSKNKSIVLNTQSFTNIEVEKMSQSLMNKFNFNCEVRTNKGKQIIIIKSESYNLFIKQVEPYMIPDMKYKLP
jgi:LAGLIDADG DNA endonuclease family